MPPIVIDSSPRFHPPRLRQGFTTRHGGVSDPPFHSLNLAFHVGDNPEAVRENRRRAANELGFLLRRMVCAEQIHGHRVAVVTEADAGRGALDLESAVPGTDALVTDVPGILLALFFADCLPVFLTNADATVIAIAHAGWRGIVADVVENTVDAMNRFPDSSPDRLRAAIGPCIGVESFEVGEEVAVRFPPEVVVRSPRTGKPHVDLAAAVRRRLEAIGIPPEFIDPGPDGTEDTFSRPDRYFSHRRDQGKTGRMAGMIGILP
ncbi:MAG: peptidoglycan editing factor PgeF [Capsulimonadales bacterium]|nr:peptidoglycan editing factor PgeF [Capsulimonadales bacterium]